MSRRRATNGDASLIDNDQVSIRSRSPELGLRLAKILDPGRPGRINYLWPPQGVYLPDLTATVQPQGRPMMRDTMFPDTASGAQQRRIAPATLPPVTCAPWCTDGEGHRDELMWEDQYCSSDEVRVEVSAMPVVETARGLDRSHLLVGLTTGAPGTPARLTLNTDNLHQTHDINLTFLEATHLAFSVLALTGAPSAREAAQVLTSYQTLDPERQQRLALEAMRLMTEQAAARQAS
jgi:hypothetical protein